jgi:outer membrane receptor protein involved in Fe transport
VLQWHVQRAIVLLIVFSTAPCAWAVSPELLVGETLSDALAEYERAGLRLFYSSDLVRSSMRIEEAPQSEDEVAAVAELLAPHGLMLRQGLNDTWLVVRAPREVPEPTRKSDTATAGARPMPLPTIAPPLEELIVAASQYEISRAQMTSRQFIGARDLEHMPDIGDDVIRAVARLPGIASNGLSALSHFRGGEPTETLVRIDGLRLYDPFHLRDFQSVFSAIDPRIVHSMDIYTGGFPASLGDRMSGVVDVESMTVEEDLYHEFGASFFNTSFLSSGRFADSSAQWVVSARRSNLDILYDRFSKQPDRPRYSDLFSKLRLEINDSLAVTANILRADDNISLADDEDREEHASAHQGDSYEWLRLDHSLGGHTSGTTLLARTRLDSSRSGFSEKIGVSFGELNDVRSFTLSTLQSDWSRLIGERMLLDFGGSVTRMRGHYDYSDNVDFDLLFDIDGAATEPSRSTRISVQPHGRQQSFYTTLRVDWHQKVASEFGLRWNQQSIDGSGNSTLGPRLGIRYSLSERSTLRASWGRFYQSQAINELQVNDGVEQFEPPQQSEQFVVGFDKLFPGGALLRIEAYRKQMSDLRPRFENVLNSRVLLPELKPDRIRIHPTAATARGIELAISRVHGRFEWWGSLSWAQVRDVIAAKEVLRSWDQTHALSAGFHWDAGMWTMSSALAYRTGWPISTGLSLSSAAFPSVTVPGRNNERLSAFGSLDVRLSRDFALQRSVLSLFMEVANVTGRNNPCCLEFEIGDEEDAGQFVLDQLSYLNTIPSIGFLWKF